MIGKNFKSKAQKIIQALNELSQDTLIDLYENIDSGEVLTFSINIENEEYEIPFECISITKEVKTVHEEKFIPNVIEPSFGIGRLLYCILENSFNIREDDDRRGFFKFADSISPYNVCVLPLISNNNDLVNKMKEIESSIPYRMFNNHNITCSSGSIGRRYAKLDEMGINY